MSDFYGIAKNAHPDFVELGGRPTPWAALPEPEQAKFFEGVEGLRDLYRALGADSFEP
jgi:hypothetical protein